MAQSTSASKAARLIVFPPLCPPLCLVPPPPFALLPPPPHPPLHIGLDVEWKANRARGEDNHVAVVQLATRRHVLVFHTHLCTLPPGVSGAWARRAALPFFPASRLPCLPQALP